MLGSSRIRLIALAVSVLAGTTYLRDQWSAEAAGATPASERRPIQDAAQVAFKERASGRVIAVEGVVERTLADDRDGSPHQRFIIRTPGGISVLIAHNLDLAPRLAGLQPGESVRVLGEYEWNEKGGVMHWTHGDPKGRHTAGYIEWRGRRYQ